MKSGVKQALFRLDSGGRYGLGHLMRSKALADSLLTREIECTFAVKSIHSEVSVIPHQLVFINSEEDFLPLAQSYDILIIDHYEYTSALFFQLSRLEKSILVVLDDECNRGNLYADIIINPIAQAEFLPYFLSPNSLSHELLPQKGLVPEAKLLSGSQYIMLKSYFQGLDSKLMQQHTFEQRASIAITFGGSDVTELTLPVLKAIKKSSLMNYTIVVVTAAGYKNVNEIMHYCHQNGFKHQHNVENMATLFLNARFAISAAGSTAFELACCGVPAVFAIVADNQFMSIKEQSDYGWCSIVDCRQENHPDELVQKAEKMIKNSIQLEKMSKIACSLIDGKGAQRVALSIENEFIFRSLSTEI